MYVLLHSRPGAGRLLAGDAVQARATAAALRDLGVRVDLAEDDTLPELGRYDLVHLFNLMPVEPTHAAMRAARAAGKPVVLSPIFWDPTEFLDRWDERRAFADWWRRTDHLRRDVLEAACLVLPNAQAELDCLRRVYGILPGCHLVPNGVDSTLFRPTHGRRAPIVLSVARISARKNQLALLDALRGTDLAVELVGPVNDFAYYRACRAAAWPGVRFLPEVGARKLPAVYARAAVHVLCSWYETPGLATLEAAACGCQVVSTDRGSAREYLGEGAWYCRPDDPEGIRRAVFAALAVTEPTGLAEMVRSKYDWRQAARATLAAYETVL